MRRLFMLSIWFAALGVSAQEVSFERDVQPIFAKACAGCHFPTAERLKGKLDVSTAATLITGGENGAAVVPGKAGESYLIALIEQTEEPIMPPKGKGNKLSDEEIAVVRAWIDQGAKGSGDAVPLTEPDQPSASPPAKPAAPAAISAAAFSPNAEQKLLAYGTLHDVLLYNVAEDGKSLTPQATLAGHAEMVRALAFSPDGTLLAAGGGKPGRSGEIKIWNVADHSLVRTIEGHQDNVLDLAFSPDGTRLASASYDKTIAVWDVASGESVHLLKHHVDAVYSVAFSPDGTRIASGAGDRTVKLWDAETGAMITTLADSQDTVYAVAFAPNGKHLAGAGADKMIRVWYLGTSDVINQSSQSSGIVVGSTFAHDAAVLNLVYAPDGATLYSSSEDKHIKIWDANALTEKAHIEDQSDWAGALALSADGSLLAAGRFDSTGALYASADGTLLASRAAGGEFMVATAKPSELKEGKVAALDVGAVLVRATVPPSLQSVGPDRWHRGSEVEVTLQGKNLDGAVAVASNPNIQTEILEVTAGEEPNLEELSKQPRGTGANIFDNARPYTIKMKLALSPDTPLGRHELMFRTPTGMTNPVGFTVILAPDVGETEPNNTPEEAAAVAWPTVLIGQITPSGDVDRFKLQAAAGDEIVMAVTDSGMNTSLKVLDAAGTVIADSREFGERTNNQVGFRADTAGEYTVELADTELRAGLGYRLHIGRFPAVTEYWPLGVRSGIKQAVHVKGFNLPGETVEVEPAADATYGTRVGLPIPGVPGSPIALPSVVTGPYEEADESEGNDTAEAAQAIGFPFTVNGHIQIAEDGAVDQDCFRFTAKQGQRILIETMASRLDSPLDSVVEIVNADNQPLERAVVRCVAQTYLVLSGRDSRSGGMRFESWTDFNVNDYVMVGGEIGRLSRLPDYPDEDVSFATYPNGQRMGYFGTTPQYHAVNAKAYRAEIHPPGSTFPPNGMPIYPLYWRNDDGFFGDGDSSGDSLLEFEAPADGEYVVRVRDAREAGGADYAYRLTLREPAPSFDVFPSPFRVNIGPGSVVPIDVRVRRNDGFDGPVTVTLHDLPEGFSAEPDVILPGEERVKLALHAAPGAQSTALDATFKVTAESTVNGDPVVREGRIGAITVSAKQPDVIVNNGETEVTIKPGGSGYISVKLDRFNGFTSRSPIDVLNLPFGVRVMDTGLNGILVREGETDRRMELYVEPWVQPMTRNIYIQSQIETPSSGNPVFIGSAIKLIVSDDAPAQVAANP